MGLARAIYHDADFLLLDDPLSGTCSEKEYVYMRINVYNSYTYVVYMLLLYFKYMYLSRMLYKLYYVTHLYSYFSLLTAVDAHVGQLLFHQCLLPLINTSSFSTSSPTSPMSYRPKGILLVTNALQFASYFTHIIVLRHGKIIEKGKSERYMLYYRCIYVNYNLYCVYILYI